MKKIIILAMLFSCILAANADQPDTDVFNGKWRISKVSVLGIVLEFPESAAALYVWNFYGESNRLEVIQGTSRTTGSWSIDHEEGVLVVSLANQPTVSVRYFIRENDKIVLTGMDDTRPQVIELTRMADDQQDAEQFIGVWQLESLTSGGKTTKSEQGQVLGTLEFKKDGTVIQSFQSNSSKARYRVDAKQGQLIIIPEGSREGEVGLFEFTENGTHLILRDAENPEKNWALLSRK
jgi:hypothetical protein